MPRLTILRASALPMPPGVACLSLERWRDGFGLRAHESEADVGAGVDPIGEIDVVPAGVLRDGVAGDFEALAREVGPVARMRVRRSAVVDRYLNVGLGLALYATALRLARELFGAALIPDAGAACGTTTDEADRVWTARRMRKVAVFRGLAAVWREGGSGEVTDLRRALVFACFRPALERYGAIIRPLIELPADARRAVVMYEWSEASRGRRAEGGFVAEVARRHADEEFGFVRVPLRELVGAIDRRLASVGGSPFEARYAAYLVDWDRSLDRRNVLPVFLMGRGADPILGWRDLFRLWREQERTRTERAAGAVFRVAARPPSPGRRRARLV